MAINYTPPVTMIAGRSTMTLVLQGNIRYIAKILKDMCGCREAG